MSLPSYVSGLSGWYRLLIVVSIVWIMLALVYSGSWRLFVLYGVMPVTLFWGIVWIERGFREARKGNI